MVDIYITSIKALQSLKKNLEYFSKINKCTPMFIPDSSVENEQGNVHKGRPMFG